MAPLNLPFGPASIKVTVQPVVLFNICDSYLRRGDGQDRVVGTLLGTIEAGVVDIKASFAVPHNETPDMVALDIPHNQTLYDLHLKVNPKEAIVGWYSTGPSVSGSDALIQDYYGHQCSNPVHLTVDTTLSNQQMAVKAYVARTLTLGSRTEPLATQFQEVLCHVETVAVEKIGVDLLSKPVTNKLPTDIEGLNLSFAKLEFVIAQTLRYVEDVEAGRRKGDRVIGRLLADTVDAVPLISRTELETLFNDNIQDVLLVMYLANLVRAHVSLADKLGTASIPLL